MQEDSLYVMCIWIAVAILCVVGIFWNPSHWLTAGIAIVMASIYGRAWYQMKNDK